MSRADRSSIPSIFLDADVLIAGSASTTGASHVILQLGELGLITLVSSRQVRVEVERNLQRKIPSALPAFNLIADAACRWVEDPASAAVSRHTGEGDPKDLPVLIAASEAGCPILVTFNTRHYRPTRLAVTILTPGETLTRIRELLAGLAGLD